MNISEEQFAKAFPSLPHCEHPSAANGYGWLGNGFGWQLESFSGPGTSAVAQSGSEVSAPPVLMFEELVELNSVESSYSLDEYIRPVLFKTKSQNFYQLRDENLQNGTLFEDPEFPANVKSLRFNSKRADDAVWLRPKEIATSDAKLFNDDRSIFGVMQGALSNCWFVTSVTNLAMNSHLVLQVVPDDQGFDENYAGIFHFRFWQYGKWIDIVIDDRLPTKNNQLIYTRSVKQNEFWSALLEKAYAKLYGNYQIFENICDMDTLQDFTGGVTEVFQLTHKLPKLFEILSRAMERHSLACVLIRALHNNETINDKGLIKGHCYTITHIKAFQISNQKVPLVRLCNPWGGAEWKGAWSSKSPEWNQVPEDVREKMGLTIENDGEFWMTFNDFEIHCDYLKICNLTPDLLSAAKIGDPGKKRWEVLVIEGSWVYGLTDGGKENDEINPQYQITLTEADEDEDDSKCTLIVALLQKHRRLIPLKGFNVLPIGFAVYSIPSSYHVSKRLNRQFFKNNKPVGRTPGHFGRPEVNCRLRLSRGTYCIVPSTVTRGQVGSFILRVFSEQLIHMQAYDDSIELGKLNDMVSNRISGIEEREIDKRAQKIIVKLANENMEIDWSELKAILDSTMKEETQNRGFSEDICRNIVFLSDANHSGKLDYQEFSQLWFDIKNWKAAFKLHDENNSCALCGFDLREAFDSAGYVVSNRVLTDFIHRYGNKESELNFESFILCALKLKVMIGNTEEPI